MMAALLNLLVVSITFSYTRSERIDNDGDGLSCLRSSNMSSKMQALKPQTLKQQSS